MILFCCQAKIEIPFHQEEKIVKSLREKDDPILWASYLLYAKYSKKYYQEIRNEIGQILQEQIAGIVQKESIFTYREFWWVLIFNKADCLTSVEQDKIDELIASIKTSTERSAGAILGRLFKEYLMNSSIQFFEWDMKKRDFLRNFTFMTKERSIFKNYQQNLNSLEWGSLLPWYPQTMADLEKRKNALKCLKTDNPRVFWSTLKKLLPSKTRSTSGNPRPKYLKLEIPEEVKVTNAEAHECYVYLVELAVDTARNENEKLVELIDQLGYMYEPTLTDYLECLENSFEFGTDENTFEVWLKLRECMARIEPTEGRRLRHFRYSLTTISRTISAIPRNTKIIS